MQVNVLTEADYMVLSGLCHGQSVRELERCLREIADIEALTRIGHPDLQGLCLALAEWSAELRIIQWEIGLKARKPAAAGAGRAGRTSVVLPGDRVNPRAVLSLGGLDSQSHLLAERARHEPADRMRLPARSFHDLGEGSTFGTLDHF